MMNAVPDWQAVLAGMSEAFSSGDNPRGEELLGSALDAGAPWDVATSTAANALSARLTAQRHGAHLGQHQAGHGTPAPA